MYPKGSQLALSPDGRVRSGGTINGTFPFRKAGTLCPFTFLESIDGVTESAGPMVGLLTVCTKFSWVCESMLVILLNLVSLKGRNGKIISRVIQCKNNKKNRRTNSPSPNIRREINKDFFFFRNCAGY